MLIVALTALLTFAVLCTGLAIAGHDWALLGVPACLTGPVLAALVGSSVVATRGGLLAWGRDLVPGSVALVAGVNVGPSKIVAGHLRVIVVASNGAARWVSARGFTNEQMRTLAAQVGAPVAINWDAQITKSELGMRFPGAIPLWRARPGRSGPPSRLGEAPGAYLALAGGAVVVLSLAFPFASSTFAALSSPIPGIPGIPAFTFAIGPSLDLELVGLVIGWCAAVAAVERLVLRRASSFSALTVSASLAGGLAGASAILGILSDLADPGFSTAQAGPGITLFFFGVLLVGCGAAMDIVAPAGFGGLRARAD